MYSNFHRFGGDFFGPVGYGSGGYIMMGIGIILVGVLIYFLVKNRNGLKYADKESPLELLQKRFINGEINREEFIEMKNILKDK